MAKRKKKAKRRSTRVGSIVRVRRKGTAGLGALDNPSSALGAFGPPTIGALATGLTAIGIRMMTPTTQGQMKAIEYAPWIGAAAGSVVAVLVTMTTGRPAGIGVAAGSTLAGAIMLASEAAARRKMAQQNGGNGGGATAGVRTGAIVMEPHASRGYGTGPMGAIVPSYSNSPNTAGVGAYGDVVNVRGTRTGSVNQAAFGTPGFNVQRAR